MKSEPDVFSIDDLKRVKKEPWSGVRNFQARNYMRDEMVVGDRVLFYHSRCPEAGVYGVGRVASKPYADPTQFDSKSEYYDARATPARPLWYLVDIAFVSKFKQPVLLKDMRKNKKLASMITLRQGNRLSITPVREEEFAEILRNDGGK